MNTIPKENKTHFFIIMNSAKERKTVNVKQIFVPVEVVLWSLLSPCQMKNVKPKPNS